MLSNAESLRLDNDATEDKETETGFGGMGGAKGGAVEIDGLLFSS